MSWKDKLYCQANVYQKAYPNRLNFLIQSSKGYITNEILSRINGKHKIAHKSVRLLFDPYNKNTKYLKCNINKWLYGLQLRYKSEELEKLKMSLKN